MASRALIKLISLFTVFAVLTGCNSAPPVNKHAVNAAVNIKITDPILHDLAAATRYAEINADGEFNPGTYEIKGMSVKVEPGTSFNLILKVPVDNPDVLSTENATGKLSVSKALAVNGFPVPELIELAHGKASGDVDILRSIGAFLLNTLEDQVTANDQNNDVRQMLGYLHIDTAKLELRPGTFYRLGQKLVHLGPDSRIELDNAAIDSKLNYTGTCHLHLNFLNNSKWIGEKTDCLFSGGNTDLSLNAQRINNELTLSLAEESQKVALKDCTFKWGEKKDCFAHADMCVLNLKELVCKKKQSAAKPELHVTAIMNLDNTHLIIKTQTQVTDAQFPEEVPAQLKLDLSESARQTQFSTQKTETASSARIEINRPTTNLTIWLKDANVGPIALDKFGQLQFSLAHGTAKLKQLDWSTARRKFTLATAGESKLTLPQGMELSLTGKPGGTKLSLPITVQLGAATISGGAQKLKLSNLNGALLVDVDKDARITSDMSLSIQNSSLLGTNTADVKAIGLDLQSKNGKAVASIKTCSVALSDDALEAALRDEVPKRKTFKLNKAFPQQHWRYRNAVLRSATIDDLRLDSMQHEGTNVMRFTASGEVSVQGTIEKTGLIAALRHKTDASWEERPWSASGHVSGGGTVRYNLVPNTSLAASLLQYQLVMQLPIPDDVDLDWSRVCDGLLQEAERAIIIKQMKKITVPINYTGKIHLCQDKDDQWRSIKISHLTVKPSKSGTLLSFSAQAIF